MSPGPSTVFPNSLSRNLEACRLIPCQETRVICVSQEFELLDWPG